MKKLFLILMLLPAFHCSAVDSSKPKQGSYDSDWIPAVSKTPASYWTITGVMGNPNRNSLDRTEITEGLQYHLLAQSIQGLAFLAIDEGKGKTGVWMEDGTNMNSYRLCKAQMDASGMKELGKKSAVDLACNENGLRELWKGKDGKYSYVLTDVAGNPESANVAAVASHVYNAVIVDVRDAAYFNSKGYAMRYDASKKSLADAWKEFGSKCSDKALVIMPVQTAELRSYAIAHRMFVLNLNKKYRDRTAGQNGELFDQILMRMQPNTPVFGWESGVGEDAFVNKVSRSGNMLVPYDWGYNSDFTALNYKKKTLKQFKTDNPNSYNYDPNANYVSFYLSDGDNIQWMMNAFDSGYYTKPEVGPSRMSFGVGVCNLAMISPEQMNNLVDLQNDKVSIIETFGGGYHYVDIYGEKKDRAAIMKGLAENVASHMRQTNCRLLSLTTLQDCTSARSQEGYKAFVEANDKLEGIVVIQYSPYAGGQGKMFWYKNSKGYNIPVITVRYSIWNFGQRNDRDQGTPAFVANRLNTDNPKISAVCVHAWSTFSDMGDSNDLLAENGRAEGSTRVNGAAAVMQSVKRLGSNIKVVNFQELVWQARMHYYPEETKACLAAYK